MVVRINEWEVTNWQDQIINLINVKKNQQGRKETTQIGKNTIKSEENPKQFQNEEENL